MKLIVGLGNPGDSYVDSRHNIGFSVIKALSKRHKVVLKRDRGTFSLSGRVTIELHAVILAMPLTFMNLSGSAVKDLLKKHKVSVEDLLVVLDDLDLELGRLRIRAFGSSGGHRGLTSIIEALGTSEFARLRIGVGRPPRHVEASEYVLLPFRRSERAAVTESIDRAVACCEHWTDAGITGTMNIFNKEKKADE